MAKLCYVGAVAPPPVALRARNSAALILDPHGSSLVSFVAPSDMRLQRRLPLTSQDRHSRKALVLVIRQLTAWRLGALRINNFYFWVQTHAAKRMSMTLVVNKSAIIEQGVMCGPYTWVRLVVVSESCERYLCSPSRGESSLSHSSEFLSLPFTSKHHTAPTQPGSAF